MHRSRASSQTPLPPCTCNLSNAQESGIISDPKAIGWPTTAGEFGAKAKAACSAELGASAAAVAKAFPTVTPEAAAFFCADLAYCHTLLTEGFRLGAAAEVTLIKQVGCAGWGGRGRWGEGGRAKARGSVLMLPHK